MPDESDSQTRGSRRGPRLEPPDVAGYELARHIRLPLGRLSLIGLATVPLWTLFYLFAAAALGGPRELRFEISPWDVLFGLVIILVAVPIAHEVIHGVVARILGARPSYGIGAGFAYTTFREPVRRGPYAIIGLAPLIVISAAGLAVLVTSPSVVGLTLVFLVTNAAGAIGDIWMVWQLRTVPSTAQIYDLADGFAYYLPESHRSA